MCFVFLYIVPYKFTGELYIGQIYVNGAFNNNSKATIFDKHICA
jgi:hypothetical protein